MISLRCNIMVEILRKISLQLPISCLDQIDEYAVKNKISRAEVLRNILKSWSTKLPFEYTVDDIYPLISDDESIFHYIKKLINYTVIHKLPFEKSLIGHLIRAKRLDHETSVKLFVDLYGNELINLFDKADQGKIETAEKIVENLEKALIKHLNGGD